ncbi:MAG: hypothetical protein HMLIMOIP_000121 [Candidatus Nitrosomirales archaeon]|jgi:hypothetical protein
MSTALDEVISALNNMKETGKVDQSITTNLDTLAKVFKEAQEKWLTSRNARLGIFFYYAARNAALVVSRMKERFLSANQVDGNAKIADESLQVVGLVRELFDLTRNEKADDATTKLIIERVKTLRKVATDIKLVQVQEKELEDVDKLFNYLSKLRK